jgi:hypothetical protein
MFYFPIFKDEFGVVPFSGGLHGFVFARDQIIQVACPVFGDFAVGVASIVEHLHFWPCFPNVIVFRGVFYDVVNDPRIPARSNFPVQMQFKISELFGSQNIATVRSLPATIGVWFGFEVNRIVGHDP